MFNRHINGLLLCFSLFSFTAIGQVNCSTAYTEYDAAKKCAKSNRKILLLYFTSKYSVNSRLLERQIFNDSTINHLLIKDFIIATLFVDKDEANGTANASLQETFGSDMQPALYFIDEADNVIDSVLGYGKTGKDEFLKAIKRINASNHKLLIGEWEGEFLRQRVNLVFNEKTVVIDYHNNTPLVERHYNLRHDTLYIDKFADTSIIQELTKEHLSLKPIHSRMEENIAILYEIRFLKKYKANDSR